MMMKTVIALVLSLAFCSFGLADAPQSLNDSAHHVENVTKKKSKQVEQGGKKGAQQAGQAASTVGRKTKKSATDVGNDVKNG